MIRWSSLITRFAILILIAAVLWIARDALIRKAFIVAGESAVGARLEIGHLRSWLASGKLHVKQLAIADPNDGMKNLVQADSAVLQISLDDLARRRLVIDEGTATDVVFGAPRSKSGALFGRATPEKTTEPSPIVLKFDANDARAAWLDRFQYAGPSIDESRLQLWQTSQQLFENWTSLLDQHRSRVGHLRGALGEIDQLISLEANPLRNQDELQDAESRLSKLNREIETIAQQIAEFDQQLIRDRQRLTDAKQQDDQMIAANTRLRVLSGANMTKLLLQESQLQQAQEVLDWFASFRDAVPDPRRDFRPRQTDDRNVAVPGLDSTPVFLIKSLQLDGKGRLAGNNFHFAGTARNFSNRPDLHQEPITLKMRAQGNMHAVIDCILDRSTECGNDSITIRCPDLQLPARQLGDENSLLVNVSPCRASVEVSLVCRNGQISGQIQIRHSNLVMQIKKLDELAGGQSVADRINLELASISDYQVEAKLSGPVQQPTIQFESDLGDRFAQKFNEIINGRSRAVQDQLDKLFTQQVSRLDEEISAGVQRLAWQFENEVIQRKASVVADLRSRSGRNSINRF